MRIIVIPRESNFPEIRANRAYLKVDNWNDYSFRTAFNLWVDDSQSQRHEIGAVKIAFFGQTTAEPTVSKLNQTFEEVPESFFSLGQSDDYYKHIRALDSDLRIELLAALEDIVYKPELLQASKDEEVLATSLLRDVSLSVIKGQYTRILAGQPPLTDYIFKYVRPAEDQIGGIDLEFEVDMDSKPTTNIHAIIGRNGVGKTTILNGMISAIMTAGDTQEQLLCKEYYQYEPIDSDYFSSLVSVSFSAFDPFDPPSEQPDPSKGTCYFYIGLKKDDEVFFTLPDIHQNFVKALKSCLSQRSKLVRWQKSIVALESDENFANMNLASLAAIPISDVEQAGLAAISAMSAGHSVVLLTITSLVNTVEEKTLVLIDEPESHLHPPLLSAFIRALSELLHDRNGVAVIATHSPVVLQEVPRSCVWKLHRFGESVEVSRPDIETFGENVGVLTREVFRLETVKSGFHNLLAQSVDKGETYEGILQEYNDQLGMEAKIVLKALITNRDKSN